MFGTLDRRDFLKSSAAFLAALSLSFWFHGARPARGQGKLFSEGAGAFTPIASELTTGQPIAGISAGWGGTQWVVDALGIPNLNSCFMPQMPSPLWRHSM